MSAICQDAHRRPGHRPLSTFGRFEGQRFDGRIVGVGGDQQISDLGDHAAIRIAERWLFAADA